MANTLITSTLVTKESGFGYTNKIRFVSAITRKYDDYFAKSGSAGKIGDTLFARMPVRFEPKTGQAFQQQNIYEFSVPVPMEEQFQVGMGWSSAQWALEIEEVKSRYVDPATATLANQADVYAYNKVFKDVYTAMGTAGSAPTSLLTYMTALAKLVGHAVDDSDLALCLSPISMATIVSSNATLFNPASDISEQYRSGMMTNESVGIRRWYREPNVQSYLTGTFTASTPIVSGANQTGSSILSTGWGSSGTFLKKGDTLTLAGVYSLNDLSYTNTAVLQDFVVTADCNDTTGTMTIPISPSIIITGSLRTVSNAPAANAVISVRGATGTVAGTMAATQTIQNLLFHKEAFTFVTCDLLKPAGNVDCQFFRSAPAGVSIRFLQGYDMINDQNPSRLDMLGGAATLQARGAARIYA